MVQVKKLEEEKRVMAEKHVEEMNRVIEESKASAIRTVLQTKIEMSTEDPSGWDVDAWRSLLDSLEKDEEMWGEGSKDDRAGALVDKEGEVTLKGEV